MEFEREFLQLKQTKCSGCQTLFMAEAYAPLVEVNKDMKSNHLLTKLVYNNKLIIIIITIINSYNIRIHHLHYIYMHNINNN